MKKKCITFITLICTIYIALFIFGAYIYEKDTIAEYKDDKIITINDVQLIADESITNIHLPSFIDINDGVTLRLNLNYLFTKETKPSLIIQANHSYMSFSLNGNEIYKINDTGYSQGNYIARILLPEETENDILDIKITVPENSSSRILVPEIYIGDEAIFLGGQLRNDVFTILLNTLIAFCGLFALLLAIIERKNADFYKLLLQSAVAINCAVYFMCETYSIVYLTNLSRIIYFLDFATFSLIAPSIMLMINLELDGIQKKINGFLVFVGLSNAVIQMGLAMFDIIEMKKVLAITQVIQFISIATIIVNVVLSIKNKKKILILYLTFIIAFGGAIDLSLSLFEVNQNNIFFMRFGFIVYMFALMYRYVCRLMEQSAEKTREIYYRLLALHDSMTACYSRAAFEIDKNELKTDVNYTVFSFDLNNLKIANDSYGHSEGDKILKGFSAALQKVFSSFGKCYRVGGDEFWVVCESFPEDNIEEVLIEVKNNIDDYNNSNASLLDISYAIGISKTNETSGDIEKALNLADQRMYINKRETKGKLISQNVR